MVARKFSLNKKKLKSIWIHVVFSECQQQCEMENIWGLQWINHQEKQKQFLERVECETRNLPKKTVLTSVLTSVLKLKVVALSGSVTHVQSAP